MLRRTIYLAGVIAILIAGYYFFSSYASFFLLNEYRGHNASVINKKKFTIIIKQGGAILLETANDNYLIESSFSYPGESIGYNRLGFEPKKQINIKRKGEDLIELDGDFEHYSLVRSIKIFDDKIVVKDTLKNKQATAVGIMLKHKLTDTALFREVLLGGHIHSGIKHAIKHVIGRTKEVSQIAENPTVFVKGNNSNLGIAAQDSVFRLKLIMDSSLTGNTVTFGINNFALDSQKSHGFEWVIYPLAKSDDYFPFINRIRKDWKTNFTVQGPFDFFDVVLNKELIMNPDKLRAYFMRKRVKIVALTPWLDYTNFNFESRTIINRAEYKEMMQRTVRAIKQVDKTIKVIGCIEGNLVTLPDETARALYNILPDWKKKQGIYESSDPETKIIRESGIKWNDSIVVGQNGNYVFEIYHQMKNEVTGEMGDAPPMMAVAVYSELGNSVYDYWLEQAHFMIENVGLDGIYIDQFSMAFDKMQRFSYEKWDGITVDIDNKTGKIDRKYTDASFAGIGARQRLAEYVFSKGKIMVANTHSAVKELQAKPIYRFLEGGRGYNPLSFKEGKMPKYYPFLAKAHMGSPISLGERHWFWGDKTKENYAKFVFKSIILYLRHGLLYYCFNTEIPESGPGAGEFELINNMFPITPSYIGEGFIEGEERIITAVSGSFNWQKEHKPSVRVFNADGRATASDVKLSKTGKGWVVDVKIKNWEEIAIVN